MNFANILKLCLRIKVAHRVCEALNLKYIVHRQLHVSEARVMAQRSITSFFKQTPPKIADKDNETERKKDVLDSKINGDKSSDADKMEKKSTKRARLQSSESETDILKPPETASEKKKKPKRQRIESSGSESETKNSLSPPSPKFGRKIKQEKSESPSSSPENDKSNFKVDRSSKTKTYESPKSMKRKSNKLSDTNETNGTKMTDSVKKESKNKITVKKESAKKNTEKDSPEIIPSPKSKGKIKEEVVSSSDAESPEKNEETVKVMTEMDKKETIEKVPEVEYNPAKTKYHPINDACWGAGQPVPYLALARTLELIEATSARLKIVDILSNYFRSVITLTPEDLLPSIYLCLNKLAPAYHSLELGIAETYLMKAVGQCTGQSLAQVRAAAARAGDLGAAAAAGRAAQRTMFAPPPLTARKVFAALKEIAHMTGHASVSKKIGKIQSLFVACRHCEAKYLIRSLEGKLRVGLAEQSVLQALGAAVTRTPPAPGGVAVLDASEGKSSEAFKSEVEATALLLKTTYCECPNYELVVPVLLAEGAGALAARCRLTVGIPLKPMLAHPTRGVDEVFSRFEGCEFTCEWKYDGERAQIHVPSAPGGAAPDLQRAAIFSRNQEDNTSKYPDVVRRLGALLKPAVSSCVLDCEAVAYDTTNKQILPFQILSTRKRKDAREEDISVQVCVFVFDLLYLNGEPLVRQPLCARRQLLRDNFNEVEGSWQFALARDCTAVEEVQQFLEEAVRGSCEGLMVKTLAGAHAHYDIARRSRNWLKLKKDYLCGAGDSLDVVVIGAYVGRGKRRGAYGGFLCAARDAAADGYQALCKLGTGFSDEQLRTLSEQLDRHRIHGPRNYYSYDSSHTPDVWFAAACVWEVRCADLSLSPTHRAAIGLVERDKGISLRFPRFVRVRDDKAAEQATSAQQVAAMYLAQDAVRNQPHKHNQTYDDFY